jgi:hypothetical protein
VGTGGAARIPAWLRPDSRHVAAFGLLLAMLLAVGGGPRGAERPSPVRVELDVFSGRPNPAWDLSPDEEAELARLIAGLPPSRRSLDEGGLGYRGFVIRATTGAEARMPDEVRVHHGVVRVSEGGRVRNHEDTHGLERWLQEQARGRGHGDVLRWSGAAGTP